MSAPRRHSDFDVLDPGDVHPRGEATFEDLRKAYNLTVPQAKMLGRCVRDWALLNTMTRRSRVSMVRRCHELFYWDVGRLWPTDPLGIKVAFALDRAPADQWAREHPESYPVIQIDALLRRDDPRPERYRVRAPRSLRWERKAR